MQLRHTGAEIAGLCLLLLCYAAKSADITVATFQQQLLWEIQLARFFPLFPSSCYEQENPQTKHSFTAVNNSETAHLNFSREEKTSRHYPWT